MSKATKRENMLLFFSGVIIGFACFLITYGTDVLKFTYNAWLFLGDTDLKQHYIGWCHYRTSPWTFPIGMIDSLSYPTSVAVIWTDSIPLFAVVFKLFRAVLPQTFQYFGLFAFLSFGLQGGISACLIRKVTNKIPVCLMMSLVFVWSYPVLQRTFYHTSLGAQWIILLALFLWLDGINQKSIWKQMITWGLMGILCVMIHSYFLPMVACIMCGSLLEGVIRDKNWKAVFTSCAGYGVGAIITLFVLGAFGGGVSPSYGAGSFEMNLNSLFNSLGHSKILPELPMYFDTQYEGFAYLGTGMLVLVAVMVVLLVHGAVLNKKNGKNLRSLFVEHPRKTALLVVLVIFVLAAAAPNIAFGNHLLVHIPYPSAINLLIGIFRSNGRFSWPIVYILLLGAVTYANQKLSAKVMLLVVSFCVLFQLADLTTYIGEKRDFYLTEEKQYSSMWDNETVNRVIDNYDRFVLFPGDNNLTMATAYYAYEHGMTVNRYYYARDIDKQIAENLDFYAKELEAKNPEANLIYVFDSESFQTYRSSGLHFYKLENWIIGTADEIDGLEEVKK